MAIVHRCPHCSKKVTFCRCGEPIKAEPTCEGHNPKLGDLGPDRLHPTTAPDKYEVKPYTWRHGDREGMMYQIVRCTYMAQGKDEERVRELVGELNSARHANLRIHSQERKIEALEAQVRRMKDAAAPCCSSVRQAIQTELDGLPHGRWSSHRKQIEAFARAVMGRLSIRT